MSPILSIVTAANEAAALLQAAMPLIQQYAESGKQPTPEEVRAALSGMDAALKRLDDALDPPGG